MRWLLEELIQELKIDPDRRILFVEGSRDLPLWRELLPEANRGNVVVYPIGLVDAQSEGGERGRSIKCGQDFLDRGLENRVLFFVDADLDRLLSRAAPRNVVFTDGRDVESYLLNCDGLKAICLNNANPDAKAKELHGLIKECARPIGIVRYCSEKNASALPFQKTIARRLRRYVVKADGKWSLDSDGLIRALFQNCGLSLSGLNEYKKMTQECSLELMAVGDEQIIQGKDLTECISLFMNWGHSETDVIISMALVSIASNISRSPCVSQVIDWAHAA